MRGGGLVQFGPSAAFPHGGPGDRRLARGDVVLIDAGCKVRGYNSDVTRTVFFGPPSDEVRRVYAAVDRAQRAGIEALRAGASRREPWTGPPARSSKRRARAPHSRTGSDTASAWTGTSRPYLVRGNGTPLSAGNTVTIEPGIYLPGKFGVRIEDDYAVRESAPPASLSVRPGELVVLKAR